MPPGLGHALAAILVWSALAVMTVKLSRVPPLLLAGLALSIGGLCGLGYWRDWKASPKLLALGVYGIFGYHLAYFFSLRLAPPVSANLVNDLWPLLIILLSPVFRPDMRLTARHGAAGLMGFAGAVLLVAGGGAAFKTAHLPGYACAFAAALIWATYSLATSRLRGVPTGVMGLFCLVSGLLALSCHFLFEPAYSWRAGDFPLIAAMGLGPLGFGFYAWDAGMKRGDPRMIGILSYLIPLLSTLLLVAFTGGTLTANVWLAMGLIVGGAVLGGSASDPKPA
ncbi:MAG: DMT family transporter [Elusimicrobia bacterium]|nr:DMT family transporter [Elusimicrobiota bacterium]